jgi:hypothetical protein
LHAVAFAQAVRNMEAYGSAEHLDGGFEKNNGGGAVHVVVAVKKDRLGGGDGPLDALDGSRHAEHQRGVVEVGKLGVEEGVSLGGLGDAASYEQLCENQGQMRVARQSCGGLRMLLGHDPSLPGLRAGGLTRRSGYEIIGADGHRADHSSSSS